MKNIFCWQLEFKYNARGSRLGPFAGALFFGGELTKKRAGLDQRSEAGSFRGFRIGYR